MKCAGDARDPGGNALLNAMATYPALGLLAADARVRLSRGAARRSSYEHRGLVAWFIACAAAAARSGAVVRVRTIAAGG